MIIVIHVRLADLTMQWCVKHVRCSASPCTCVRNSATLINSWMSVHVWDNIEWYIVEKLWNWNNKKQTMFSRPYPTQFVFCGSNRKQCIKYQTNYYIQYASLHNLQDMLSICNIKYLEHVWCFVRKLWKTYYK